jgi:hypothetical protein
MGSPILKNLLAFRKDRWSLNDKTQSLILGGQNWSPFFWPSDTTLFDKQKRQTERFAYATPKYNPVLSLTREAWKHKIQSPNPNQRHSMSHQKTISQPLWNNCKNLIFCRVLPSSTVA